MLRWFPVVLLGLLTACSHTPRWPTLDGDCPDIQANTGLLQVHSDRGRHNVVVHRERSAEQVTYVALDAIGAPQFSVHQSPTGVAVEQGPLYRGVDPQWLLWGWQWWQLREHLSSSCADSAGLVLRPLADNEGWQLNHKERAIWRWMARHPDQYELPEHQARVTVRELSGRESEMTSE